MSLIMSTSLLIWCLEKLCCRYALPNTRTLFIYNSWLFAIFLLKVIWMMNSFFLPPVGSNWLGCRTQRSGLLPDLSWRPGTFPYWQKVNISLALLKCLGSTPRNQLTKGTARLCKQDKNKPCDLKSPLRVKGTQISKYCSAHSVVKWGIIHLYMRKSTPFSCKWVRFTKISTNSHSWSEIKWNNWSSESWW